MTLVQIWSPMCSPCQGMSHIPEQGQRQVSKNHTCQLLSRVVQNPCQGLVKILAKGYFTSISTLAKGCDQSLPRVLLNPCQELCITLDKDYARASLARVGRVWWCMICTLFFCLSLLFYYHSFIPVKPLVLAQKSSRSRHKR